MNTSLLKKNKKTKNKTDVILILGEQSEEVSPLLTSLQKSSILPSDELGQNKLTLRQVVTGSFEIEQFTALQSPFLG